MENKYFVLMVLLMMVVAWLSVYVTFNFEQVKLVTKQGVFVHWSHFWDPLPDATKKQLKAFQCRDEGPPTDECWDAMKHHLFSTWKLGGFIVIATVVLLPFNIFFVGNRITWNVALDSVQSAMSLIMLGTGGGLFVLAYNLASAWVLPCVVTGIVITVLALVQLVPNMACMQHLESMMKAEEETGKILFWLFTGLAAVNLIFSLWCITSPDDVINVAGSEFDLYLNDTALVGVSDAVLDEMGHQLDETNTVATIGWASLLVFEFLTLEALVNLNDWIKFSRNGKKQPGNRKKKRGGQRYDEVDEADEEQPPRSRAPRSSQISRSPGRGKR